MDLWRAGHTHSGFYLIDSNNGIESVFCDMSELLPVQSTARMTLVTQDKFV
jgi:hypothetical protein